MLSIYKYELEAREVQLVEVPKDAQCLRVAFQRDHRGLWQLQLWCLVDPEAEKEERVLYLWPTGADIEVDREELLYVGTDTEPDTATVWHIFERVPQ